MNKKVMAGVLGATMLVGGHRAANAQQNYQDLRGQLFGFTGNLYYQTSLSALGGLVNTSLSGTLSIGTGSLAAVGPQTISFSNSGPANDSALLGYFALPTLTLGGIVPLPLPTLTLSGSFGETSGAFNMKASAPTFVTPPFSITTPLTLTITVTATNPSASFVGQAINAIPDTAPNTAVITNTAAAPLFLNPTVATSIGAATLNSLTVEFIAWTLTAVPGPESIAVFLPGMGAGLALLRKRRRATARYTRTSDGPPTGDTGGGTFTGESPGRERSRGSGAS